MNEISHNQARYLIRRARDRRLPEEQWAALQEHLERCEPCRAYQSHLDGLEKDLRRSLLARWRAVAGPGAGVTREVLEAGQARAARFRLAFRLGIAVLVVLAAALLLARQPRQLAAPPPLETPTPLPSPTPTPAPGFEGVVLYAERTGDRSDIFLLSANGTRPPDIANLTQSPADDTDPIWSPDGEWIAFRSDSSGKRELYMMTVAGTRLTRLTSQPNIDWQGPLTWSADGKWIALAGRRSKDGSDLWIYLVPVDPSAGRPGNVRSLPGTRGTTGWARFSPSQPLLAAQRQDGTLLVFDTDTGWNGSVTGAENLLPDLHTAVDGSFDWALGGNSLVYLAGSLPTAPVEIRMSVNIGLNNRGTDLSRDSQPLLVSTDSPFHSVTFQPRGMMAATLQDDQGNGCWALHLVLSNMFYDYTQMGDVAMPGLCISSRLERASWAPPADRDAVFNWLVVAGSPQPGSTAPQALYALQVPSRADRVRRPPVIQRLTGFSDEAGPVIPRVRPSGRPLNIEPRAAEPTGPILDLPASTPSDLPGTLVMAVPDAEGGGHNSAIVSMLPDGLESRVLLPGDALNACPAWSPDRQRIAFVSDRNERAPGAPPAASIRPGPNDIYLMDAGGGQPERLTRLIGDDRSRGYPQRFFGCPVWSPDGRFLAAEVHTDVLSGIMVFHPDGSLVRYISGVTPTAASTLAWSRDSRYLLAAEAAQHGVNARLVEYEAVTGYLAFAMAFESWDDVQGFAPSPDGTRLALILTRIQENGRRDAVLREYDLRRLSQPEYEKELYGYDPRALAGAGHIAWMQDQQLVFAIPASPLELNKAMIMRYIPSEDAMVYLAISPDALLDWAIRGPWLVYLTEGGLWGAPVNGRLDKPVSPLLLSPGPGSSLAWR